MENYFNITAMYDEANFIYFLPLLTVSLSSYQFISDTIITVNQLD